MTMMNDGDVQKLSRVIFRQSCGGSKFGAQMNRRLQLAACVTAGAITSGCQTDAQNSGGVGAVSIGISEWMVWAIIVVAVIAGFWLVAKVLLAAFKG
jgi:hypothetical protein